MNHVVDSAHLSVLQSQRTEIATIENLEPLVELLSSTCAEDRLVNWLVHDQTDSKEKFFRLILANAFLTKARAITNEENSALLCWVSPKEHAANQKELIRMLPQLKKLNYLLRHSSSFGIGIKLLQPFKRSLRSYHISILAVHPSKQKLGLANLLLEPLFKKSDEQKIPVTVELTEENQLSIFRHYDFHVIESVDIPEGPTIWHLMRSPN